MKIQPVPRCPHGRARARASRASFIACAFAMMSGCSSKASNGPDAAASDATPADAMPASDALPPDAAPTPPLFSPPHGFYTEPFELTITPPFDGVDVFYTLDGRDPAGATAQRYTAPLPIDTTTVVRVALMIDSQLISRPVGQSYIFAEHIPAQQAPADYPNQWWAAHEDGPFPADYTMDPDIVEDPGDADMFPATFYALPAVSIVMDPDELFGPTGIHENSWEQGRAWERAGSAEIFDFAGTEDVQVNCAISIHGGSSRQPDRSAKKSFRLEFKSAYGPSKLEYKVFEDSPVTEFDVLVLRGGYNRSWAHYSASQRDRALYMRERLGHESQRAMGHLSPRARYAHLFVNGLYWGLYMIQERPNAAFQASYLGGKKSEYDALNIGVPVDGDRFAWDQMMALVETGLDSPEAYAALQEWLDIEGFTDYMILNHYMGNVDWPDRNWYVGRKRAPEGRFRFFSWDTELTFGNINNDVIDNDFPDTPGRIFLRLRDNPEFVVYLGDRIHRHLFNSGELTPGPMLARFVSIAEVASVGVYGESARWGDHWRDARLDPLGELYNHDDFWLEEYLRMTQEVLLERTDVVIRQYRTRGLYPSIGAPLPSRAGGPVPAGYQFSMTAGDPIYYTTDGTDPRLPGGALSQSAVLYAGPVTIDRDMTIKARAMGNNGGFSALLDLSFTIP